MSAFSERIRLDGKVAVVTGAAGILGRGFCAGLAEFGATVAALDLDQDGVSGLAEELEREFGGKAAGFVCDVSSSTSVSETIAAVVERFGSIHVLHNNAATKSNDLSEFFASYEEYSLEEWRSVMAVNLDGMFLMSQAVGRVMIAHQHGGSIVQTGSIYGILAPDQRIYEGSEYLGRPINSPAVYSASKAAVDGLTRYLAAYWADKGIRVNTLTPGGVSSGQNDEFRRRYSARVPLGRMAERDEMVSALLFLASDASSYITGHNLIVDGGLHAW